MRTIWAIAKVSINELIRKKDFYVLFIFMLVMLGFLSIQNFFDIEGITRYVRDFGYTLVMLFSFIIAVTFSAKQIPEEIERKTIYPLLAKPVSRFNLVAGKFLGGIIVSTASFLLYYGLFAAFYLSGGESISVVLLIQGFIFGILFLCMVCALAVFFSNFLTVSANVSISIILYFVMISFSDQFRQAILYSEKPLSVSLGFIYYILPHLDFYDLRIRLAHSWDPLAIWVIAAVVTYTVCYCLFLLYISGKMFQRKQL